MSKSYETLLTANHNEHIMLVTINRPKVANAFNTQMAIELVDLFENLAMHPTQVRAIVITGAGERAFCCITGLLVGFVVAAYCLLLWHLVSVADLDSKEKKNKF